MKLPRALLAFVAAAAAVFPLHLGEQIAKATPPPAPSATRSPFPSQRTSRDLQLTFIAAPAAAARIAPLAPGSRFLYRDASDEGAASSGVPPIDGDAAFVTANNTIWNYSFSLESGRLVSHVRVNPGALWLTAGRIAAARENNAGTVVFRERDGALRWQVPGYLDGAGNGVVYVTGDQTGFIAYDAIFAQRLFGSSDRPTNEVPIYGGPPMAFIPGWSFTHSGEFMGSGDTFSVDAFRARTGTQPVDLRGDLLETSGDTVVVDEDPRAWEDAYPAAILERFAGSPKRLVAKIAIDPDPPDNPARQAEVFASFSVHDALGNALWTEITSRVRPHSIEYYRYDWRRPSAPPGRLPETIGNWMAVTTKTATYFVRDATLLAVSADSARRGTATAFAGDASGGESLAVDAAYAYLQKHDGTIAIFDLRTRRETGLVDARCDAISGVREVAGKRFAFCRALEDRELSQDRRAAYSAREIVRLPHAAFGE